VISPEGCASILWKSAEKAELAAEAMGITAPRLLELGLIDELIPEPLGGAHRNPRQMATLLRDALLRHLYDVERESIDCLMDQRYDRLMSYGVYEEGAS
jgi:acetyl-CoA carboxylase carboxyl transferase subunit alpha